MPLNATAAGRLLYLRVCHPANSLFYSHWWSLPTEWGVHPACVFPSKHEMLCLGRHAVAACQSVDLQA